MKIRFVPSGLQNVVRKTLCGSEGLFAERDRERTRATEAKAEIHHWTVCEPQKGFGPGDPYYDHLTIEIELAARATEIFESYIAFHQRLIEPELMYEVYDWLRHFGQADWAVFVISARQARFDQEPFRKLQRKARKTATEIEATANKLAKLILDLRDAAVILPPVFWEPLDNDSFVSLGSGEVGRAKLRRIALEMRGAPPDAEKDAVQWLRSMAAAAASMDARFACPAINAALQKRQNSKKSAYLRAFAALLEEAHIDMTSTVMKAMAVTANVVFDDPEFDACEDDVRKAIRRARPAPDDSE